MEKSEITSILSQFASAVSRFEEVLKKDIEEDDAFLDASIQRFEFCFELCWKVLKRCLEFEGYQALSPREAFTQAFKLGWLKEGDDFWSNMIENRNLTSHTYKQETATKVYQELDEYCAAFSKVLDFLKRRFGVK